MQQIARKNQKIRSWENRVGIDLDEILQQAKELTGKDPNVSFMYAPYDKGPYAVPNLGVNYNIYLNASLSFDPNLSQQELAHRNLHMLAHELGHHKSGWTELRNHFHYELGMKHDVLDMDTIDYESDNTKEDLMIDCRYSEKSLQYAYGFLSSNTPSTIRDAIKLRHINIEKKKGSFEANTIREADFIQLMLRIMRRAIVADKIKSDWKGVRGKGIKPSSVDRWVSNMKAQWDIYTHSSLRFEELRNILIAIKNNAQAYINGREDLELEKHLNRLRRSISFPNKSTSEAKLIAKSRREFKNNKNQALREHPLSRPVAEANFS